MKARRKRPGDLVLITTHDFITFGTKERITVGPSGRRWYTRGEVKIAERLPTFAFIAGTEPPAGDGSDATCLILTPMSVGWAYL